VTAFVLGHQLAIVFAAIGLAVLGAVLHVRDVRRTERKAGERAEAYVMTLTEDEIEEILDGTDRRQP
jgi:hypothetical protein